MINITSTDKLIEADLTNAGLKWKGVAYSRRQMINVAKAGRLIEVNFTTVLLNFRLTDITTWSTLTDGEKVVTLPISQVDGVVVTDIDHLYGLIKGLVL